MTSSRPPRKDPFGQRYLRDTEEVFEYNAWDNVEFPDEFKTEIERTIDGQKEFSVAETQAKDLVCNAGQNWDNFYKVHTRKFFMDRKWLIREFPEVFGATGPTLVLDVGCGVGNTTFPLLEMTVASNPDLFTYCCDFSQTAVDLVEKHELFDRKRCQTFQWDVTDASQDIPVKEGSLDFILCIYVLSALSPEKQQIAVNNLSRLLKNGGMLYVKDYGRHDLTQLRFKKDRYISDNFYCRGDGTLVYFFSEAEIHKLMTDAGLHREQNFTDKRLIVNRAKQNKKQLLRLSCEVLKYKAYLDRLLCNKIVTAYFEKYDYNGDPIFCTVLLYEILFGRGIKSSSGKLRKFSREASGNIKSQHADLQSSGVSAESFMKNSLSASIPRYARINDLKISLEEVVGSLQSSGFVFREDFEITTRKKFRNVVKQMNTCEVFMDRHISNLLVFHPKTDLHAHSLVTNGCLILQDKASCLPAVILNPEIGSEVVDTCAAPGMKTSHLAALLNNNGAVYAFDRDGERCNVLRNFLRDTGADIGVVTHRDFLQENVEAIPQVHYALVDPPCSGSGMVKRGDFLDEALNPARLHSLSNIQAMLLKHALRIPNLKRLVYSTCSIHTEENEAVIAEVVEEAWVSERYKIADPMPLWRSRGIGDYEFSPKCLRADPEVDLTNVLFEGALSANSAQSAILSSVGKQMLPFLFSTILAVLVKCELDGEKCNPEEAKKWKSVQNNPHAFLFCHPNRRIYKIEECSSIDEIQKVFDEEKQQCVQQRPHRHPIFGRFDSLSVIPNRDVSSQCPLGRLGLRFKESIVECSASPTADDPSLADCGDSGEFRCAFSSPTSFSGVCCRRISVAQSRCPQGMRPIVEMNGNVRPCSPRRVGVCRTVGSVCFFDSDYGDFHCCEETETLPIPTKNIVIIENGQRSFSRRSETSDGCPRGEQKQKSFCSNDAECPFGSHCYSSTKKKRQQCCGKMENFCEQTFNNGIECENPSVQQYYYEQNADQCSAFLYLGCGGNSNRFHSFADCEAKCRKRPADKCKNVDCSTTTECINEECYNTECPFGFPSLKTPDGNIQKCSAEEVCPNDYECLQTLYNYSQCCQRQLCPKGYIEEKTTSLKPIRCNSSKDCSPVGHCSQQLCCKPIDLRTLLRTITSNIIFKQ